MLIIHIKTKYKTYHVWKMTVVSINESSISKWFSILIITYFLCFKLIHFHFSHPWVHLIPLYDISHFHHKYINIRFFSFEHYYFPCQSCTNSCFIKKKLVLSRTCEYYFKSWINHLFNQVKSIFIPKEKPFHFLFFCFCRLTRIINSILFINCHTIFCYIINITRYNI